MAQAGRRIAFILLACALAACGVAWFAPWWSFDRNASNPSHHWEDFGPYHKEAPAGQFKEEVGWIGNAWVVVTIALAAALVWAWRAVAHGRGRWWMALCVVVALAAVAVAAWTLVQRFPEEARSLRPDNPIDFQGSSCHTSTTITGAPLETCVRTQAGWGFYVALLTGLLPLFALAILPLGRAVAATGVAIPWSKPASAPPPSVPVAEPRTIAIAERAQSRAAAMPPRPVERAPEPAPPRAMPSAAIMAGQARTGAMKCPQCQTRLSFVRGAGPTNVRCHNCGRVTTF